MKSTVEQLSPTRVKINVEVPFDELKPNFDRAYRKIAQQVRIPGFRPGKAPAPVLEKRLGRGVVLEEVVNEAVPAKYAEIVSSGEVRALGRPDIEVTKIEDGDHLAFTAEVDVRPEIEIPPYDFSVAVDNVEVTDDEVMEQINGLRTRFGTLTGVDRPVQEGDFVLIDLSATVDGKEVKEAATSGFSYEVGSGRMLEGIDDALIGAAEGESRTFTAPLVAGKYAGRDAEVTVTVQAVKRRDLPPLDDDFAQLASEFDTLDELKADMRRRLGEVKARQQAAQGRDKVLEALVEATEVPLPEGMVQAEFESRKHDAVHVFDHDHQRLLEWLEEQGQTEEQFDTDLRESAEQVVKVRLVLDAIADAENIEVTDEELSERIVMQAQRLGLSPQDYVRTVQDSGELAGLYAEVRRGKALAVVVRQSTVTTESGDQVDFTPLYGEFGLVKKETPATAGGGDAGEGDGTAAIGDADQGDDQPAAGQPTAEQVKD